MSKKFKHLKGTTLREAKDFLNKNWKDGVSCPCCRQYVKLYKRTLNSGMAYALVLIYKISEKNNFDWIHVQNELHEKYNINAISIEYNKLEHWGLIEKKTENLENGSSKTGLWRITEPGKAFVFNQVKLKKRVHIYNKEVTGFSGAKITIEEALKNKFDYNELLGDEIRKEKDIGLNWDVKTPVGIVAEQGDLFA